MSALEDHLVDDSVRADYRNSSASSTSVNLGYAITHGMVPGVSH